MKFNELTQTITASGRSAYYVDEVDVLIAQLEAKIKNTLEALIGHDVEMLLAKAKQLKQTDGEGWAIGELVERAVVSLEGE